MSALTKDYLDKQSILLQAARLLGAAYTKTTNNKHALRLPCGMLLLVTHADLPDQSYWQLRASWPPSYRIDGVKPAAANLWLHSTPLQICRRVQSYVVANADQWDNLNQLNK